MVYIRFVLLLGKCVKGNELKPCLVDEKENDGKTEIGNDSSFEII